MITQVSLTAYERRVALALFRDFDYSSPRDYYGMEVARLLNAHPNGHLYKALYGLYKKGLLDRSRARYWREPLTMFTWVYVPKPSRIAALLDAEKKAVR